MRRALLLMVLAGGAAGLSCTAALWSFAPTWASASEDAGLAFIPDPGIRVDDAANPAPIVRDDGTVYLMYHSSTAPGPGVARSADGLDFEPGRDPGSAGVIDPFANQMLDGSWRLYQFESRSGVLTSRRSATGLYGSFAPEPGVRYTAPPEQLEIGVWDEYVNDKGEVVLIYIGGKEARNPQDHYLRHAISTDGGHTFALLPEQAFATLGAGPQAYVDPKFTPLPDGRVRLFTMMQGQPGIPGQRPCCSIYSFISEDGGRDFELEPGTRLAASDFTEFNVWSLNDPWVVQLPDGRFRMYVAALVDDPNAPAGKPPFKFVIVSATTAPGAQSAKQQPVQPSPPPAQDGQGPYFHQVLSASSPDGLNWTFDDILLLDHASVPAAIVTPEGNIRIYYVDASQAPENTNCAESTDGGKTFAVLGCTIDGMTASKALDPSIVLLPDGRYRLYFYGSAPGDPGTLTEHSIYSAISEDGIHFTEEARVFSYPGLVDPDVFWTGQEWLMFVFALDEGTIVARSADGLSFSYVGALSPQNWGTTAPVHLEDGTFRLYAFNQPQGSIVASFQSTDGLTWTQEQGVRLTAPEGYHITDPFVVQLPDGTWKMVYKTGKNPSNQPPRSNAATPTSLCTTAEISLSDPAALPLLARAQASSPERYRFALEHGAKAYPTSDGKSFALWWLPPTASAQTPPLIVTLHGSLSWAFDEFFLWYPYALERGYGILALQWWLGGDETHLETEDYYAPNQVYPILECALRSQGVPTERSLLHGFSRGSANIYAVTALDRDTGNDFFKLIVANAGGASSDFPDNVGIDSGAFGPMPFEGTHWAMFCGGRDPNPDRDGCPAMHRTQDWVSDLGGAVDLFIEDPDADHGGFHHTPTHVNAVLDVFDQLLASD